MSKSESKYSNNKTIVIKCGNSQHTGFFKGTSYSESEFHQQPFSSVVSNQSDYIQQSYVKYLTIYYNINRLSSGRETQQESYKDKLSLLLKLIKQLPVSNSVGRRNLF